MPFHSPGGYPFLRTEVLLKAPVRSGVYGLYTTERWIYVGEGEDMHARLLGHLNGDSWCITKNAPTDFIFELCPPEQRAERQNQLILELQPVCNQRPVEPGDKTIDHEHDEGR